MKKIGKILLVSLLSLLGMVMLSVAIGYFATSGEYLVADTVAQDPSLPHIGIDGHVFHAEAFGSDTHEVVIVIHGGPGGDYRYLLSLKDLSDEYLVVFYDQRGTGLSPRVPDEELTLESSLEDLDGIVDHYRQDRKVNLIGHSWGAMLASGYLGRHPEKVRKIVLAEPGMLTDETSDIFLEITQPRISLRFLLRVTKIWLQSLHVKGPDDQARADFVYAQIISTPDPEDNPVAKYFCDEDTSGASSDYWRMGMAAFLSIPRSGMDEEGNLHLNLVEGVDQFKDKVLFLSGQCNQLIGAEHQRKHLKHFPNAELVVLPDCGHYMFSEKPQESVAVVRSYFKE